MAKQPDLVIGVSGATNPAKAKEMEGLGLRVNLISLSSLSDVLESMRTIARLLGVPEAGQTLARNIAGRIQNVKKRIQHVKRRSVLLVVGIRPLIAVGRKNFIDELITLAGGENIAGSASQPWLNVPEEFVVAKAPQVIIER
jgi:iron complex transport system substrate-binding protein